MLKYTDGQAFSKALLFYFLAFVVNVLFCVAFSTPWDSANQTNTLGLWAIYLLYRQERVNV